MASPLPSGATASFANISDLGMAREWSNTADWCSPATIQRGTLAQFNSDTLPGAVGMLGKHLQFGAGLIESATLKGEFYQIHDLQALVFQTADYTTRLDPITNSGEMLVMMNAWLAIMSLSRRKTRTKSDDEMISWAIGMLEELQIGKRIFSLAATADAGLAVVQDTAPYGSPEYYNRPSIQAYRMFGSRGDCRNQGG